jgi:hypothetical protein
LKAGQSCRTRGAVLIDVENVRGKSGFRLSYEDVVHAISLWVLHLADLRGRVVLVMDHGSIPSSFWLPDKGISIVFSGPFAKADDVLAVDAVPFFTGAQNSSCCVVTADRGLIKRCHRMVSSGKGKTLSIVNPQALIEDLEQLMKLEIVGETFVGTTDWELQVGVELLETNLELRACTVRNKRRKALKLKVSNLEAKLNPHVATRIRSTLLPLLLEAPPFSTTTSPVEPPLKDLSSKEQAILARSQHRILTSSFQSKKGSDSDSRDRERTRDRVTRVERMRLRLEHDYGHPDSSARDALAPCHATPVALEYARSRCQTLSNQHGATLATNDTSPLRVVVVSDTYSNDPPFGDSLPPGDLLLHLGGFSARAHTSMPPLFVDDT